MHENRSSAHGSPRPRLQFTLRTLMLVTAGSSLVLGLAHWGKGFGLAVLFAIAGLCLAVSALLSRGDPLWERLFRFTVGSLVFVAMLLLAVVPSVASSRGARDVTLSVSVRDAADGKPIPRAVVRIVPLVGPIRTRTGGSQGERESPLTDPNGTVQLPATLRYNKNVTEYPFGRVDTYVCMWLQGDFLEVDAEGYQPARESLKQFARKSSTPDLPSTIDVSVKMSRIAAVEGVDATRSAR